MKKTRGQKSRDTLPLKRVYTVYTVLYAFCIQYDKSLVEPGFWIYCRSIQFLRGFLGPNPWSGSWSIQTKRRIRIKGLGSKSMIRIMWYTRTFSLFLNISEKISLTFQELVTYLKIVGTIIHIVNIRAWQELSSGILYLREMRKRPCLKIIDILKMGMYCTT